MNERLSKSGEETSWPGLDDDEDTDAKALTEITVTPTSQLVAATSASTGDIGSSPVTPSEPRSADSTVAVNTS